MSLRILQTANNHVGLAFNHFPAANSEQREYERQKADGQALLHIQASLESVIAARSIDEHMRSLVPPVSNYSRAIISGRYQELTLDGTAPTRIAGTFTIDTPCSPKAISANSPSPRASPSPNSTSSRWTGSSSSTTPLPTWAPLAAPPPSRPSEPSRKTTR